RGGGRVGGGRPGAASTCAHCGPVALAGGNGGGPRGRVGWRPRPDVSGSDDRAADSARRVGRPLLPVRGNRAAPAAGVLRPPALVFGGGGHRPDGRRAYARSLL